MSNKLSSEKSPYLLQHADNPVDWHPWGEEAFARAKGEDKPIFLSVGYSTCHWCHVMAHESFENKNTAELLNASFISIKVDREERPDVDRIYMGALQAMGISGGWPMSIFLTPDLKPFYGGTYFPPENSHGRVGFPELLRRLDAIWRHKRSDIVESGDRIISYLRELAGSPSSQSLDVPAMITLCRDQIQQTFDKHNGGFGSAPKFPRPVTLAFLSRVHASGSGAGIDGIVLKTLRAIANGGVRDHVGGGFHRYAVDGEWRIPHFEKMLYDQAQIIRAFVEAAQFSREQWLADVAADTVEYVLRDLQLPEGGFASAEDADSQRMDDRGKLGEGAFYVWTRDEAMRILGSDGPLFAFTYGIEADGNVEIDPHHEFAGQNILFAAHTIDEASTFAAIDSEDASQRIERCRRALLEARNARPRPLRDDKIITAWNGLMIGALARAARVCDNDAYAAAAERAADFLLSALVDSTTGELRRSYRGGEAKGAGQLQDYAFLVEGLLDLFESRGGTRWLSSAIDLTETQVRLFWDDRQGGFFDTAVGDRSLLVRTKEQYDGAEPTGNSVAAMNLWRLSALTGNAGFRERAEATVKAFGPWLEKQPSIMPYLAAAALCLEQPPSQIVIAGKRGESATERLWRECDTRYLPFAAKIPVDPAEIERLAGLIPYAGQVKREDKGATAYVCVNFACQMPVDDPNKLGVLLDEL
jgi:uncharacterized protein